MVRPVAKPMRSNQNLRVFLEATESTRLRMEESLPNYHENHIAGKGDNSLQHKIIPMPSSHENSCSESSSGQGMGKIGEKIPACDLTKVRSKNEVIDEARTKGAKVHFASLMDNMSFEEC